MGIIACRRFTTLVQSEHELRQKLLTWNSTLEAKDLKVNVSKTKVMFGEKCNKAIGGHKKLNIRV